MRDKTKFFFLSFWVLLGKNHRGPFQAAKSRRKRQYRSVGVMQTGQRFVLITASVIHLIKMLASRQVGEEETNLLQKIWPHMLAVMSSHVSAKHARQCSGLGLVDSVVGVRAGDFSATVCMLFE